MVCSDEHFTVDGTPIEAWAGHKSFKRKDNRGQPTPPDDSGYPSVDLHGERRSNLTHHRPPITRPAWPARARARRPSSAMLATC